MGFVRDSGVEAVMMLLDLKEDEDEEPLEENWDIIRQHVVIFLIL